MTPRLEKKNLFVSLFSPVTNKSDPLLLCIKEVEVRQDQSAEANFISQLAFVSQLSMKVLFLTFNIS